MYRRVRLLLWPIPAVAVSLSCAEPGQAPEDPGDVIPGLIISNPVAAGGLSGVSLNGTQDEVTYISMPPGALPGTRSVRIRNVTANGAPTGIIAVIVGGFDPVALAARAGDRLELSMGLEDGSRTVSYLTVPLRRPPRIVRTSPTRGRTDVALSTRPLIVFSEPIDARTLSAATVQLVTGGVTLNGRVAPVSGDVLLAEFIPAAPLTANTSYELLITNGVRDLTGDALESSERIPFRTQAGEPAVALLRLSGPAAPLPLRPGFEFTIAATVVGSNGNTLTDRVVSWSISDPSVASVTPFSGSTGIALVHVTGAGSATITASSGGRSTTFALSSAEQIAGSKAIEIVNFTLYEWSFGYGSWSYTPRLRVKESTGRGVIIVGLHFSVPGSPWIVTCATRRTVAAGQTLDVVRDFYPYWDLLSYAGPLRAVSSQTIGTVYFQDASGITEYISVSVPIVEGWPPMESLGETSATEWWC